MSGSDSRRSAGSGVVIAAIAAVVAACNWTTASAGTQEPVLRKGVDAERGRIWTLTVNGVELYEAATGEKVAHIPLPGWVWASEPFSCPPDLALGPKGEAIISSNVVPTLWRIDPERFSVSRHDLVLDADSDKDVGFTGLAYSAKQEAFFAISASQGSLWRIDPLFGTGHKMSPSAALPKACGLGMKSLQNLER